MAWLARVWHALRRALRWLARHTRERLSPRGRLIFDWVVGLSLILIGALMGLVPILQGWIFGLAGLAILSKHSPLARRWFERFKRVGRSARERYRSRRDQRSGPD